MDDVTWVSKILNGKGASFYIQVPEVCSDKTVKFRWRWLLLVLQKFTKSKKSPTGPTERTPKPEYLISLATYLGVRW